MLAQPNRFEDGGIPPSYGETLKLARKEIGLGHYLHAGELLNAIAEAGQADPEFFVLLGKLNEAEGRPFAARLFYLHAALGRRD